MASVAAVALGLSLPPGAATAAPFTSDQKAEMGVIIKDYIMAHPEVLRDAITELDDREKLAETEGRRKTLAAMGAKLAEEPDSLVIGNPAGAVTLVEFFDYNCGYCKRSATSTA